jgi:HPt (histidine-containing phosphotransfer) domain-containing protein
VTEPVDRTVLDALEQRLGERGPAFRASIVGTFGTEAAARRVELDRIEAEGDVEGLRRLAHGLRSAAGSLGAGVLAGAAGKVEDEIRSGAPVDVSWSASTLRRELDRAEEALRAQLEP